MGGSILSSSGTCSLKHRHTATYNHPSMKRLNSFYIFQFTTYCLAVQESFDFSQSSYPVLPQLPPTSLSPPVCTETIADGSDYGAPKPAEE